MFEFTFGLNIKTLTIIFCVVLSICVLVAIGYFVGNSGCNKESKSVSTTNSLKEDTGSKSENFETLDEISKTSDNVKKCSAENFLNFNFVPDPAAKAVATSILQKAYRMENLTYPVASLRIETKLEILLEKQKFLKQNYKDTCVLIDNLGGVVNQHSPEGWDARDRAINRVVFEIMKMTPTERASAMIPTKGYAMDQKVIESSGLLTATMQQLRSYLSEVCFNFWSTRKELYNQTIDASGKQKVPIPVWPVYTGHHIQSTPLEWYSSYFPRPGEIIKLTTGTAGDPNRIAAGIPVHDLARAVEFKRGHL
jgi:hypothetical protein